MNVAFHEGTTVVVFNEACPFLPWHCDVLGKSLFFKVTNGKVISIGKEIIKLIFLHFSFEMIHNVGSVSFDLLICSDCKESYFYKPILVERMEANTPYYCILL